MHARSTLLLLSVAALGADHADAVVLRVGTDAACDAAAPAAAIALLPPGPPSLQHEIRLNRGDYRVAPLVISQRSVAISGGWIDCSDPDQPDDAQSALLPEPGIGERILSFDGGSTATELYRLDLRLLGIARGEEGGIALSGRAQLTLGFGTEIDDSRGAFGGGVQVIGSGAGSALLWPRLRVTDGARIRDNRSNFGGGIHCAGAVVLLEGARFEIRGNRALDGGQLGGGIFAEDCILAWIGGAPRNGDGAGIVANEARLGGGLYLSGDTGFSSYDEPGAQPRVVANRASEHGAGLYVASGAQLNWSSRDFEIGANEAASMGGGLYLESGASGDLCAASIVGNRAGHEGGALLLDGGSFTTNVLDLDEPYGCHGGVRLIADNVAGIDPGWSGIAAGGALRVRNGSQLILNGWTLRGNRAPQASAIFAQGPDTRFFLRSVALAANRSEQISSVVRLSQVLADLHFISAGGNQNATAILETLGGGELELHDSAIHNPPAAVAALSPGTVLDSRCVYANEAASLAAFGAVPLVADPRFLDAGGGDLRVAADSPVLDACAGDQSGSNYLFDARLLPRPVNLPQVDLTGPWDAGAFEMRAEDYDPDVFGDGFE
jgi:hypothetical protein